MTVTTYSPQDGEAHQRTYVTCLHCGEELAYNWQKMRMEGRSRVLSAPAAPVIPIESERTSMYRRLLHADSVTLTRAGAGR
jgi:RNase P subunit RPR2